MTVFILIHSPLYHGTGGGVENGTILLTDFFMKSGIRVFLLSRDPVDPSRQIHFPEQTFCFPDSKDPNSADNKDFIRGFAQQYPQAVVWDRGGSMLDYLTVCSSIGLGHPLTSLHCDILSVFDCFTQRIEEAPRKKQLLRYCFYPVFAVRYYWQYIRYLNQVVDMSQYCVLLVPGLIEKMKRLLFHDPGIKLGAVADPLKYPVAAEDILYNKEKRIVLCSRLEHCSKRIDYFLRIWREIENDFPDWQVSIIGGPGANSADWIQKREMVYLKSLCAKWHLSRITFHDYCDPGPYYSRSAIYALTSRAEGFCDTLLEAQAFGCAVIAFDAFPSTRVLIQNGKNGFCAKAFSIRDYAQKLSCMMRDEELRKEMGKVSLANARQYSIDKIGQQWIDVFQAMEKKD